PVRSARPATRSALGAAPPAPPGGRYLRDAAGKPTGVVLDRAKEEVQKRLPKPTVAEHVELLKQAEQNCLAVGLTTVTDMGVGPPALAAYDAMKATGAPGPRVAVFLTDDDALLAEWFARGVRVDPDARF